MAGTIVAIVWVLIELVLLAYLITKIRRYRSLSIKDTIVYPILVVLTLVLLVISRAIYMDLSFFDNVKASFTDALSIAALSINKELMNILQAKSIPLVIAYYGCYAISFVALSSLTLYCLDIAVRNIIRLARSFFSGDEIIRIFGFTEDAKKMMKNFKHDKVKMTCVLDSGVINKYVEEKTFLDKHNIGYIEAPFKMKQDYVKTIRKVTRFKHKKYIIITFFEEDKKNDEFSSAIIKFLKDEKLNRGNVRFIMNVDEVQEEFIKRKHHDPKTNVDTLNGKLRTYNKYNLNALLFVRNHPFSKYLNFLNEKEKGFINDDCTLKDVDIHIYTLGFGKVNQPLLRDSLIINQFVKKTKVSEDSYKLEPYEIGVDVYDSSMKLKAFNLTSGLFKYNKKDFKQNDYLPLPHDYTSNVNIHLLTNVEEMSFINKIYDDIKERMKKNNKKQVNFFFVSLDSDMYNCLIAENIRKHLSAIKESYNFFFVRKDELNESDKEDDFFKYIGSEEELFSTKNVLLDDFFARAKREHFYYSKKENIDIDAEWLKLSRVKQKSNIYAIASLPFKKELLNCKTKEDYLTKYNPNKLSAVDEKDIDRLIKPHKSFDPIDVIAFSEHERWNAYEYAQGLLPMKISLFNELNKNTNEGDYAINQTADSNYHLCITSQEGLVEYYKLFKMRNFKGANVISYDYDLMNHYIEHFES